MAENYRCDRCARMCLDGLEGTYFDWPDGKQGLLCGDCWGALKCWIRRQHVRKPSFLEAIYVGRN